jgi:ABC-2 type transport system ATP-binding protein
MIRVPAGDSAALAVEVRGLAEDCGAYGLVDRLDHIEVPAVTVSGFIGQDGAGEGTAVWMLLGAVRPDAGRGRMLGVGLIAPAGCPPRVGVALIEGVVWYPGLSGVRNLAA